MVKVTELPTLNIQTIGPKVAVIIHKEGSLPKHTDLFLKERPQINTHVLVLAVKKASSDRLKIKSKTASRLVSPIRL